MSDEKWAIFEDNWEQQGFTQIANIVSRDHNLSMQARHMYTLLKAYAWESDTVHPGYKRMEKETGAHRNTIRQWIVELQDYGLLTVRQRRLGKTNQYVFHSLSSVYGKNPHAQSTVHTSAQDNVRTDAPQEVQEEYADEEYPLKNSTNPNGLGENAPPDAPEPEEPPKNENLAGVYVAHIARKLDDATVPLDAAYKMRFGKDIKAALKKGVEPEVLDMAVARIVERWDDYQLSLRQAMTDITNKKTTNNNAEKKPATPEELIERIAQRSELKRYASVARVFDFTSDEHPDWKIMKELGGTSDEQHRNLTRIKSIVRKKEDSANGHRKKVLA